MKTPWRENAFHVTGPFNSPPRNSDTNLVFNVVFYCCYIWSVGQTVDMAAILEAMALMWHQGLYSLSGKTSYRKISWSLEAARFGFKLFQSLWNLAGTSAAMLPRCLSNFRAIRPLQHPISRLRDFTRFGGKTSYRLVNRGPVSW